jgi:PD-(D/E)XK endonuclease
MSGEWLDGEVGVGIGSLQGISLWAERERKKTPGGAKAGLAGRSGSAASESAGRQAIAPAIEQMTPKELGELAEAEFLRRALAMRIAITKPWGESRAYDFIVDAEGKLTRVQVKAAFREGRQGGYSLRVYRSSKRSYTKKEIDALAGYAAPENAWYLLPVRVIRRVKSLKLFPGSRKRRSKLEKWREAWWLLRGRV